MQLFPGVVSAITTMFPAACMDCVLRGQFYYYFECDINFKVFIVVAISITVSFVSSGASLPFVLKSVKTLTKDSSAT